MHTNHAHDTAIFASITKLYASHPITNPANEYLDNSL